MPLPKKSTNKNTSLPSLDEDFQSVPVETVANEEPSYSNSLPVQESIKMIAIFMLLMKNQSMKILLIKRKRKSS